MKFKLLTFLGILIMITACQEGRTVSVTMTDFTQIENLKTDAQRNDYLQELWEEDQGLRKGQDQEILAKYGAGSKEYKTFNKKFYDLDQSVFQRLKKYLEVQGYPEHPEKYDELAING